MADPLSNTGTIGELPKPQPGTKEERALFDKVDSPKDEKPKEDPPKEEEKEDDADADTEGEDEPKETEDDKDKPEKDEEEDHPEDESDSLIQSIKKESPDLLKKIPALRATIFREQAYSELYPSVDDAKEAKELADTFRDFQQEIENGDPSKILEATKELGSEVLVGFASNFLPALQKLDKETYLGILAPEIKKIFRAAVASKNEYYVTAAKNLNHYLFGDTDVDRDEGIKPKKADPKEDKQTERERSFENRIYQNFAQGVSSEAKGRLMRVIGNPLKDTDIKPIIQKKLVDEVYDRITKELDADKRHSASMQQLWLQAKKADFSPEWKDRIITAFLSRAKGLTSKHRQEVLTEAGITVEAAKKEEKGKPPIRIPAGAPRGTNTAGPIDTKKVDYKKVDERALLDGGTVPMKS